LVGVAASSENDTASGVLALFKREEGRTRSCLKYIIDTFTAQAGAFQVPPGADFACRCLAFLGRYEPHRLFPLLLDGDGVFSKVLLQPYEDDGDAGTKSRGFFYPLEAAC
jgi:hypothetical protein